MKNQTIPTQAILAVYAMIEHKMEMHEIVTQEQLKKDYQTEACALRDALHIMLGQETMWETVNLVHKLANENKAAA
jgi:hypothetical protein